MGAALSMPRMVAILLTGMSGTGKSTVVDALGVAGVPAVDLDDGYVVVHDDGTQDWDEAAVTTLLDASPAEVLVLAGCEQNMVGFLNRFDAIVLLTAPEAVLRERVLRRTSHDFGKDAAEWSRILADLREVEPQLRRVATHELLTDRPIDEVVEDVLAIIDSL